MHFILGLLCHKGEWQVVHSSTIYLLMFPIYLMVSKVVYVHGVTWAVDGSVLILPSKY